MISRELPSSPRKKGWCSWCHKHPPHGCDPKKHPPEWVNISSLPSKKNGFSSLCVHIYIYMNISHPIEDLANFDPDPYSYCTWRCSIALTKLRRVITNYKASKHFKQRLWLTCRNQVRCVSRRIAILMVCYIHQSRRVHRSWPLRNTSSLGRD